MAAAKFLVLSKLDRALVSYLVSQGAGTLADIVPAKRSQDRKLPLTVCWAEKGVEVQAYSGCYKCSVSILVKTVAASEAGEESGAAWAASEARAGAIFDCFKVGIDSAGDKLGQAITDAARAAAASKLAGFEDLEDFTVLNVLEDGVEAGFDEAGAWTDTLNLEVVCVPEDVE